MNYLAQIRKENGASQQEVADYLGVTRQAYGNYETSTREPDFETLLKLGEFFDVSVDMILRGDIYASKKAPPAGTGSAAKQRVLKIIDQLPEDAYPRVEQILEAAFLARKESPPK